MQRKNDPVDAHVGERLRLARTLRGFSQSKLGQLEDLSFQQIQKYERGVNRISASRLVHFANHLNFPIEFFLDELLAKNSNDGSNPALPFASNVPGGILNLQETQKLIAAYYQISDIKRRQAILGVICTLADKT